MILEWDARLFQFLNGIHSPFLDRFFKAATECGKYQIPIALVVGLVLWKGSNRLRITTVLAVCALLISDMIGANLKDLFGRVRPYAALPDVHLLTGVSGSSSFPSNHAANSFAAAMVFICEYRRVKWVWVSALAAALVVAYSRIYAGVHYPLDVAGGAVLGIACGAGLFALERRLPLVARDSLGHDRPSYPGLLVLFVLISTVYRFTYILQPGHILAGEEAHYWEWSRRLDWSYYSKPPLIAYLIRLTTQAFGHTEFGVRGGAVAISVLLSLVTALFVRALGRSWRTAFFTVLLMGLVPLFAAGAILMTTDTPLLLFWGAALYAFYVGVFQDRKMAWYLGGLFLGLGLLSKYAMIYLVPCLFLYLAVSPPHRRWLRRPQPYLALLIGLLVFSPVIYWNATHGFCSVRHVTGNIAGDSGLSFRPGSFFEFAGSQMAVLSPLVFLAMIASAFALAPRRNRPVEPAMLFLLCTSLPVFLGVVLKSLFGKAQANWAAPAYYSWVILTVVYFEKWREETRQAGRSRLVSAWIVLGLASTFAITLFLHDAFVVRARSIVPLFKKMGVENPHELDPTWRLKGPDKLGRAIAEKIGRMPQPRWTFLISPYYQTTALLAFYTAGHPPAYCADFGRRKTQYDLWPGPGDKKGWDAVFVSEVDKKEKWKKYSDRIGLSFERTDPPQIIEMTSKAIVCKIYAVTRCYGFRGELVGEKSGDDY